jgi:hypothetical protein
MIEIEERGAEAVIDDAIGEALDGPDLIYLSIDIDVVDPGMAPGTGTPEPGGLLTRELLRAVRRIVGKVDLAAMDIVEVAPPYDHAEITAAAAHRAALEAISALAVKKRDGGRVRLKDDFGHHIDCRHRWHGRLVTCTSGSRSVEAAWRGSGGEDESAATEPALRRSSASRRRPPISRGRRI